MSAAVAQLDGRLPKVASMLEEAEDDILAFYAFPAVFFVASGAWAPRSLAAA